MGRVAITFMQRTVHTAKVFELINQRPQCLDQTIIYASTRAVCALSHLAMGPTNGFEQTIFSTHAAFSISLVYLPLQAKLLRRARRVSACCAFSLFAASPRQALRTGV